MNPLLQDRWRGRYFDGQNSNPHDVWVFISYEGLVITKANCDVFKWPFSVLRQSQGSYGGESIRLENDTEILVIDDGSFLQTIHEIAPGLTKFHNPRFRRYRAPLIAFATVVAIVICLGFFFRGIPTLADMVMVYLPVSWEEELGSEVAAVLAPEKTRIDELECQKMIERIADTLMQTDQPSPYHMRIILKRDPIVNGFAAPGGYIVIHDGLLKVTSSPEELAAVLAHEMQHVLLRHSTRAILRDLSISVLISALWGDGGGLRYALDLGRTLGGMRFHRQDEAEADQKGMQMLQKAGIDPHGMVSFFETLKEEAGDVPELLNYLSTHPRTEERILRLKRMADESDYEPIVLLPDINWANILKTCSKTPQQK